jgi:hypothetical protein
MMMPKGAPRYAAKNGRLLGVNGLNCHLGGVTPFVSITQPAPRMC